MPNNDYANEPNQSRSEDIIQSILDNTEYDEEARSRIEYLLIELKNAIEGGGGGGGVASYSPLTEKPKIDNHTLQAGNNSSSDLGLQTKLTFDSAPTENSTNPVTSGGVYTALGAKANSSDVYNKSAVDTALTAKADKSTTYTKTEVDTALSSKQNTISDLSTIRSGAALGATAVQPVSGKGLSTNDYTNNEKSKLAGIEAQANKTTVDSALSGTSTDPVQNKVVKSALDGKQASLTTAQLAAVNSGITAEKLTQDENNISYIANNNVINILNRQAGTYTSNGVTFTTNIDGSITLSGTATNAASVLVFSSSLDTTDDTYILYGDGFIEGIYMDTYENGWSNQRTFTSWVETNPNTKIWRLIVSNGTNADGVTLRPMMCKKSLFDGLYHQPAMSNAKLTYNISSVSEELNPTAYTTPRPNTNYNITIESGGYFVVGKICFINVRLTVGTDIPNNTYFLYDLPEALTPLTAGSSICALNNNRGVYISVASQGNVLNASGAAITAGQLLLTGAYLIK